MVNDDFRSKHTLLVLHVWMVHKRLLTEGKPGRTIQECLFDELWLDTTKRIRALGVNELSVTSYRYLFFRFDLSLLRSTLACLKFKGTPWNAVLSLTMLLNRNQKKTSSKRLLEHCGDSHTWDEMRWKWTTFLNSQGKIFIWKLGVLWLLCLCKIRYIRHEQLSLQLLPAKAIFEGRIKWGNLPTWAEAAAKHKARKDPVAATTGDPGSPGEWKEAIAPDGRIYYWNTKTRETQWDKPDTKKWFAVVRWLSMLLAALIHCRSSQWETDLQMLFRFCSLSQADRLSILDFSRCWAIIFLISLWVATS